MTQRLYPIFPACLLSCLLLAACGRDTPDDVYQDYNDKVIEGLSFDEEKSFYTERKRGEVEEQVPVYMERMDKERDEVVRLYLAFSQEQARCNTIELVEQRIDGDTAHLEYDQTNTCGPEPEPAGKQKIRMLMRDGAWKIDDVEIAL